MVDDDPRLIVVPRAVWFVTLAWVTILLAWSVVLPTFRSADEPNHVSAALSLAEEGEWPGYRELSFWRPVVEARAFVNYRDDQYGDYPPLAQDDAPVSAWPSFADLAPAEYSPSFGNTIGQHPPLYYLVLAQVHRALPEDTPFGLEVWIMRLISVALVAPLPLVLARAALVLTANSHVAVGAALAVVCVPQLGALGGAVNNDNLLVISGAVATLATAHILRGDLRGRIACLLGLALSVALLTKAFGLVLLPVAGLALVIAAVRQRDARSAARSAAIAGLLAVPGMLWWARSYLRYGSVQPAGHIAPRPDGPMGLSEGLPAWLERLGEFLPMRFWATLSIKGVDVEPPFPQRFYLALTAVVVALALYGLLRRSVAGLGRLDAIVMATPLVLALVILLTSTLRIFLRTGVASGLQGRYVYVGLCGAVVVVAAAFVSLVRQRWRGVALLILACGGLLFIAVSFVRVLLFHYDARYSGVVASAQALVAWSPLGRWSITAIAAAIVTSSSLLIAMLVYEARVPPRAAVAGAVTDVGLGPRRARRSDAPGARDAAPAEAEPRTIGDSAC